MLSTTSRFKKVSIISCILFLLFITAPFISGLIIKEKKKEFVLTGGKKNFPKLYEFYYNHSFSLRKFFISSYYFIRTELLGSQPISGFLKTSNYTVITGKSNWLFYFPIYESYSTVYEGYGIKDYEGKDHMSDQELAKIKYNLEEQRDWLKERNIEYMVVVAPNKQTIYPEFMPDWIEKGKTSVLDEVLSYMRANSDVKIVDLREALLKAKELHDDSLYYRTDTHWNGLGAFYAYKDIIKNITTDTAALPLHLNDYNLLYQPTQGMDITKMVGLKDYYTDYELNLTLKQNSSYKKLPALLIFRDSYYDHLEPFFKQTFDTITNVSNFAFCDFKSSVENAKPKIVLLELVERYENTILTTSRFNNPNCVNKQLKNQH